MPVAALPAKAGNHGAGITDPGYKDMETTPHKHLKRLPFLYTSSPLYFITVCTHDRMRVLTASHSFTILQEEWRTSFPRHGWAIGRFVVLPDHVHFFCRSAPEGKTLSAFMQQWKQWTSKGILRLHGLPPPLWQEGFFDHVIRSSESAGEKWLYVRDNPVRAGLVANADDWPHQGHIDFP